jgi:putative DNA primase/helicase
MNCHAGCAFAAIVAAAGLSPSDLFAGDRPALEISKPAQPAQGVTTRPRLVKSYDYNDADGNLVFQSCRLEPKSFRQRHKDASGEWVWNLNGITPLLYRLPELLEAVAAERRIFIVEGEKDADALAELNFTATTNAMGAGKWRESYSDFLEGADVVILPDNDDAGRSHAEQVAASLTAARNATVKVVALPGLPEKGDVSDWLNAGNDVDALEALIGKTPRWASDPSKRTRWRLDEVWENDEMMQPPAPVVPYLAWGSRSTLLAAREKSGKSTLTGYMAAQVSRGGEFLGEPCQRGHVLIIGLEEFIGDTARRLQQFGANGKMISLVDRFVTDDRLTEIRWHIEAVKPTLVILDSLVAYSRGTITDANNATQTQNVVQGLTDLAHTLAVALVIIHHARKADGKYRDSSAIGGAVDIIAEVFPPEENTDPTRRRVRPIGRVPARGVDFRFDGYHYAIVDANIPAKLPLDQRILNVIGDRPGCSKNDVVNACGDQRSTVLTRIDDMISKGVILDDGHGNWAKLRLPSFRARPPI